MDRLDGKILYSLRGGQALINRVAARHGVAVLYYNVAEQSMEAGGTGPITAPGDMDTILATIGRGHGVQVLRFPDDLAPIMFSDRWIHMTPTGIDYVASQLIDLTLKIRAAE